MTDRITKEKRAELRRKAEAVTEGRAQWDCSPRQLLSLLDEVDALEAELADMTREAITDKRPWAEREAWDEGHAAGPAAANPYRKQSERMATAERRLAEEQAAHEVTKRELAEFKAHHNEMLDRIIDGKGLPEKEAALETIRTCMDELASRCDEKDAKLAESEQTIAGMQAVVEAAREWSKAEAPACTCERCKTHHEMSRGDLLDLLEQQIRSEAIDTLTTRDHYRDAALADAVRREVLEELFNLHFADGALGLDYDRGDFESLRETVNELKAKYATKSKEPT